MGWGGGEGQTSIRERSEESGVWGVAFELRVFKYNFVNYCAINVGDGWLSLFWSGETILEGVGEKLPVW